MEAAYITLYKTVSAVAVVLENLSKPALYNQYFSLLGTIRSLFGEVYWVLEELNSVGIYPKAGIRLVRTLQKTLYSFHEAGYELVVRSCDWLEEKLTEIQAWFEGHFNEVGIKAHIHWAFSLKHRLLVKEVMQIFMEDTSELHFLPTHTLIRFNLFYMILQRRVRAMTWKPLYDTPPPHQDTLLQDLSYYAKYAIGVYGHFLTIVCKQEKTAVFSQMTEEDILIDHARLSRKDLVYTDFHSDLPGHAIYIDHDRKSLVLIIRGSLSVLDFIIDLNCHYMEHEFVDPETGERVRGFVHGGMMQSSLRIAEALKGRLLTLLSKLPQYQLVLTGHSLGAGVASLLILHWLSDREMLQANFRGYTYATPQVVSANLNRLLQSRLITCVVGNDLVPRLSYGTSKDLCQVFEAMNNLEISRPSAILKALISGGDVSDATYLSLYRFLSSYRTTSKLFPAGLLFQIYPRRYDEGKVMNKYVGAFVLPEEYDQLVLSKTMLTDHVPLLYETVINALVPLREKGKEEDEFPRQKEDQLRDEDIGFEEVEDMLRELKRYG